MGIMFRPRNGRRTRTGPGGSATMIWRASTRIISRLATGTAPPLSAMAGYPLTIRDRPMPRYESPYDPASAPKNLEHVIYEKKGHVAYVTINRPEVRNALHSYSYAELRSCWHDIGLDPDIYCGIVTGTGDAFCAGRDVKFLARYQAEGKRTPH